MPLSEPALLADPMLALSLEQLLATRMLARWSADRKVPLHHGASGRQPGLSFKELRPYQAGDDVRHIDWRVTARLGTPHTRLYSEERDSARAVLVDLGRELYFGSRCQLKARLGCELAATLLWQGAGKPVWLGAGSGPLQHDRRRPEPLLSHLSDAYRSALATHGDETPLTRPWRAALERLPAGTTLHLITDHRPPSDERTQLLQRLCRRYPLHVWQIVDPLEEALPAGARLPARRDNGGGWLDGGRAKRYHEAANAREQAALAALLPLVTRLYRLDNGRPFAEQWQEGPCRLI